MLTANTFPQWRRIFPRTVQQSTHILAKQQSQLHVASRTELARRIRARVDNGDVRPVAQYAPPQTPLRARFPWIMKLAFSTGVI